MDEQLNWADLPWDQLLLFAGIVLGPGGIILWVLGWFFGARKRTAEIALTDAQSALTRANAAETGVTVMQAAMKAQEDVFGKQMASQDKRIEDLQAAQASEKRERESMGLKIAVLQERASHASLFERYIDRGWTWYDEHGGERPWPGALPGQRDTDVVAVIRPHELEKNGGGSGE